MFRKKKYFKTLTWYFFYFPLVKNYEPKLISFYLVSVKIILAYLILLKIFYFVKSTSDVLTKYRVLKLYSSLLLFVYQLVWLKDSNQLLVTGPPDNVLSEQSRIFLSIPTPSVRQLTISNVRSYDAGSYVCRVTLTDGSQLMSTSHLSVEERLGKGILQKYRCPPYKRSYFEFFIINA